MLCLASVIRAFFFFFSWMCLAPLLLISQDDLRTFLNLGNNVLQKINDRQYLMILLNVLNMYAYNIRM